MASSKQPPSGHREAGSSSHRAAIEQRPPGDHRTATEQPPSSYRVSSEEEQPLSRPCAATEQPLCGHRATTKQRPARSRRSRRSPGLRASEGRAQPSGLCARTVGVRTVQNCGHWRTWMRRGCRRPEGLRVASATLGPKTDARHGRIWSGKAAGGRCAGGVRWTVCGRCAVCHRRRAQVEVRCRVRKGDRRSRRSQWAAFRAVGGGPSGIGRARAGSERYLRPLRTRARHRRRRHRRHTAGFAKVV